MPSTKNSSAPREFYMGNTNLPTPSVLFEWTEEQIAEMAKCRKDIVYFAQNYFFIVNIGRGKEKITLYKPQKRLLKSLMDNRFVCCLASRQSGKALDINTPILTDKGWSTMGQLQDGDKIYDNMGKLCTVLKAHDIMYNRKCYEVVFNNGTKVVADEDHNWFTQTFYERKKNIKGAVRTTKELLKHVTINQKMPQPFHRIKKCPYLEYPEQCLDFDPYLLGVWLGDGSSHNGHITVGERDKKEMEKILTAKNIKYTISSKISGFNTNPYYDFYIHKIEKYLTKYNLKTNKHIPQIYKNSSFNQRLELLRGLMDTDGSTTLGLCTFYNTNKVLIDDMVDVLKSMGCINLHISRRPNFCNGKRVMDIYRINFKLDFPVFNLDCKKQKQVIKPNSDRTQYFYITEINEVESRPVRCITVDSPDSMFLCGKDFIPTHNTTIMTIYALWMACFWPDKRILVVANKEDTAINILRRVRLAYEFIPNWLKPGIKQWGKTEIIFGNDSSIAISTTTSSTARGEAVNVLIVDEMAFIPDHVIEEFWKSVVPIISSGSTSKIFIVSTPNGTTGKFYEIHTDCERGKLKEWKNERMDWFELPERGKKWKKTQIELLGSEDAFNQEYGNIFIEYGKTAIDTALIDEFKKNVRDPEIELEDKAYKIWIPPQEKRIYVFGVDVGEGVGGNASVIQVLDITDLTDINLCATYHSNKIDPSTFASKIKDIAQHWGNPYLLIERNNCGAETIGILNTTHHYPNLITYLPEGQRGLGNRYGIYSHTSLKYKAVMNMRYWVNKLRSVKIWDIDTLSELESFVQQENGTWKKKQGVMYFDDRVMALIWGLFALETEVTQQYFDVISLDEQGKPLKLNYTDLGYFDAHKPDATFGNQVSMSVGENTLPTYLNSIPAVDPEDKDATPEELMMGGWRFL